MSDKPFTRKLIGWKQTLLTLSVLSTQFAFAVDLLNFETVVDLNEHRGKPFFEVMRKEIKPKLDQYALDGFYVKDGKTISYVLENVSAKVQRGALRGMNQPSLEKLADKLSQSKEKITFYELPQKLASTPGFKGDRYGLTTFLALASGGGVAVKMTEDIYAYNVNYGTGEVEKDEMTGRSFGAAGTYHKADDASDAAYLKALEKIARPEIADNGKDITALTKSILDVVVTSDTSHFKYLSQNAKAVASDFVAVYTAEQDRHLMANLKTHHWDSALLEVTLLANFHAGQEKFTMMYEKEQNVIEFTDTVPDQILSRKEGFTGDPNRQAQMLDYWQFSKNPANPNRSGINITRRAFTRLEYAISDYMRRKHPSLVEAVESKISGIKMSHNIFDEVSDFLINFKTQNQVKTVGKDLVTAYTKFLSQVRLEANAITKELQKKK
jgi:hypothetical protein